MSRSKFRSAAASQPFSKKKKKKPASSSAAAVTPPAPAPVRTPLEQQLFALCESVGNDLRKIGADPVGFDTFRINPRLTRSLARSKRYPTNPVRFELEVSKMFLAIDNENARRDIIAHEMLHTIPDCFNHQDGFDRWMYALNAAPGSYNVRHHFNYDDYGIPAKKIVRKKEAKYILECENCLQRYYYFRMCDAVRDQSHLRCGVCNSRVHRIK